MAATALGRPAFPTPTFTSLRPKPPLTVRHDPPGSFSQHISVDIRPHASGAFITGVPGLNAWTVSGTVRIKNTSATKHKRVLSVRLAFRGCVETVVLDDKGDLYLDVKELLSKEQILNNPEDNAVLHETESRSSGSSSTGDANTKGITIPPSASVTMSFQFEFSEPEGGFHLPDSSIIGEQRSSRATIHYFLEAAVVAQGRLLGSQKRCFRIPVPLAWCPTAIASYLRRSNSPILSPTPKSWNQSVQDPRPGRFPSSMLDTSIQVSTTTLEPGQPFSVHVLTSIVPTAGIRISKIHVNLHGTAHLKSTRTKSQNKLSLPALQWIRIPSTDLTVIPCRIPAPTLTHPNLIPPSVDVPDMLTLSYTLIIRIQLAKTSTDRFRLEDIVVEFPVTILGCGPRAARPAVSSKWTDMPFESVPDDVGHGSGPVPWVQHPIIQHPTLRDPALQQQNDKATKWTDVPFGSAADDVGHISGPVPWVQHPIRYPTSHAPALQQQTDKATKWTDMPFSSAAHDAGHISGPVPWVQHPIQYPTLRHPTQQDRTNRDVYEATARFYPKLNDEVELWPGDRVLVNEIMEDGWAQGFNLRSEQSGVFPMGAVKRME
ncbi:uncharacterized protein SPPG_06760 [Spizellomyces punctatus DAOM BR117]|uniref:SH3 domain-containing protein n=1 Tax=Spizellomyces punctatus (strain DAOM BR117) TaxID=645134 RepID=A0A0L0HA34_SPIPD|nr:hypothetical protein, variant [Spizellomyces punctatus DAOM BR117]XP_016605800.1 uncharacterized protein SPPG_06760 [Spizellomyces punctatus DAOM BR117]KNC97759.1 hypothetical protein, variant [Spizellomyces punctatus DAOM BR117]KNC97760.1 hypothetical protein SPPG_06760 [Spizellomyces punctatus DAOM BR117]|eukprot:XP_016605799.1 hypothetical protein, variant [Spizellomyces punctatus DAOM BR117]